MQSLQIEPNNINEYMRNERIKMLRALFPRLIKTFSQICAYKFYWDRDFGALAPAYGLLCVFKAPIDGAPRRYIVSKCRTHSAAHFVINIIIISRYLVHTRTLSSGGVPWGWIGAHPTQLLRNLLPILFYTTSISAYIVITIKIIIIVLVLMRFVANGCRTASHDWLLGARFRIGV